MRSFRSDLQSFFKTVLSLILIPALNAFCMPAAYAQQTRGFTIKVNTQLVVTSVVVKDKDGKNMDGLTEKDFVLTEDDAQQEISVFEFNKFEDAPRAAVSNPSIPEQQSPIKSGSSITVGVKGAGRYQNRRLMVFFFDMTTMPPFDLYRSLLSSKEFVQKHMASSDLVSILVYVDGAIQTLAEFTDDNKLLLDVINRQINPQYEDKLFNTGAFGQDSSEFNLFNTDRRLAALQTAVNMLKQVPEKKYLVYFASGLQLNAMENQAQMRATINAAVRANVSFFPVDTRGLEAFAPLGNASEASAGGLAKYTGEMAMEKLTLFQSSQDSLYALAADTGGKALLDNNSLTEGILSAQRATTGYYTIGYYPANTTPDGKFRRVKIALKENTHAKLEYRPGYYSGKTFKKFDENEKERQLEEALMLEDPITEIPIAMEVNYFKLNSAEYYVAVHMKMPGSELLLAGDHGSERTRMDFIGEIKDNYGNTIRNMRDKVDKKLEKERLQQLAKQPIQYDTGFTLLPGKYTIKYLARNAETGRIGTYQASFAVPNLMKPGNTIPISSVVVGNQLVDMTDALFNAAKDKKAQVQENNPLVINGQKLIPSVTRVFGKSSDMFLYLQAYPQDVADSRRPVAYVTFYRNNAKAFETAPIAVSNAPDAKSNMIPFRFSFSLSELPSGEYNLQVSVLDPNSGKVAFRQMPIMLIP